MAPSQKSALAIDTGPRPVPLTTLEGYRLSVLRPGKIQRYVLREGMGDMT